MLMKDQVGERLLAKRFSETWKQQNLEHLANALCLLSLGGRRSQTVVGELPERRAIACGERSTVATGREMEAAGWAGLGEGCFRMTCKQNHMSNVCFQVLKVFAE